MRLSEFKAGTILVDGDGKVFIHDGFVNADGYGVIIGEDSDGMIQKSNGIGNWMKEGFCREATSQEITNFLPRFARHRILSITKEDKNQRIWHLNVSACIYRKKDMKKFLFIARKDI